MLFFHLCGTIRLLLKGKDGMMSEIEIGRVLKKREAISNSDKRVYYEQVDSAIIVENRSAKYILTGCYQGTVVTDISEVQVADITKINLNTYDFKSRIKDCLEEYAKNNGAYYTFNYYGYLSRVFDNNLSFKYKTPIDLSSISDYGYDLSTQENLSHAIGRENELRKIIKNLCIKNKSVILVGATGSGKTALVESLAYEIKNNQNRWLKEKTIFYVNLSSLIGGTKYRGEFEDRLNRLISLCSKYRGKIILFIDEIHTLYNLGSTDGNSLDAMNILKVPISKGDIVIIGATTKAEYQDYLMRDAAFLDRVDRIEISYPSEELSSQIILSYMSELENKYNIPLDIESPEQRLNLAMRLSAIAGIKHQRLVGEIQSSPIRLAKDIIEDAFCEAIQNDGKKVIIEDIMNSIKECEKLPKTFREESAEELLFIKESESQPVKFPARALTLTITR